MKIKMSPDRGPVGANEHPRESKKKRIKRSLSSPQHI
jgi:hypothetical protein